MLHASLSQINICTTRLNARTSTTQGLFGNTSLQRLQESVCISIYWMMRDTSQFHPDNIFCYCPSVTIVNITIFNMNIICFKRNNILKVLTNTSYPFYYNKKIDNEK